MFHRWNFGSVELSLHGTFVSWNFRSHEPKLRGTFVPQHELSVIYTDFENIIKCGIMTVGRGSSPMCYRCVVNDGIDSTEIQVLTSCDPFINRRRVPASFDDSSCFNSYSGLLH